MQLATGATHMWQPAVTAIFAAAILVAMPPDPTAEAAAAGHALDFRRDLLHFGNELGGRIPGRIGRVQPVDVGQQHQAIGAHHLRHPSGETIVVAVADLRSGDRVVLVDDGNGAELQQRAERAARIEIAPALFSIAERKQNLCHSQTVLLEHVFPRMRQADLPDSRGRLAFFELQLPRPRPRWRRPSAIAPEETSRTS